MSALVPTLLVCAALVALGVRLLAMAMGGGRLPEALLGAGFCLGSVGIGILTGVNEGLFEPSRGLAISHAVVNVGLSLFAIFCQQVFRPGLAWARAVAVALVAALVASWGAMAWVSGFGPGAQWPHILITATRLAPFGWLAFETGLHYERLRRQRSVGLGDPVVANRFLLWSIWSGCLLALPIMALAMLFQGVSPETSPLFLMLASPFGGVAAITLWLSFFPPLLYRRWLQDAARPVSL